MTADLGPWSFPIGMVLSDNSDGQMVLDHTFHQGSGRLVARRHDDCGITEFARIGVIVEKIELDAGVLDQAAAIEAVVDYWGESFFATLDSQFRLAK